MKRLLQIIALALAISAAVQTAYEGMHGGAISNAHADPIHEPGV